MGAGGRRLSKRFRYDYVQGEEGVQEGVQVSNENVEQGRDVSAGVD